MTITYGFYNSLDGDRVYDAEDVGSMFAGVFDDGVFRYVADKLETVATTGMVINVKTGKCWFDNTWTLNDAVLPLTVGTSNPTNPRIDAVVVEMDSNVGVRANTIKIIAGTPAASPVPPTMIHAGGINQYSLAHILVPAGATEIVSGNITNKVGTSECPWALMLDSTGNGATILEVEVFS